MNDLFLYEFLYEKLKNRKVMNIDEYFCFEDAESCLKVCPRSFDLTR